MVKFGLRGGERDGDNADIKKHDLLETKKQFFVNIVRHRISLYIFIKRKDAEFKHYIQQVGFEVEVFIEVSTTI